MDVLKLVKNLVLIIFIIAFSTSCTHYYYGPNSANVPLLTDKKDAKITANLSLANETTGGEVQAAFAVENHVGVIANLYYAAGRDNYTSSNGSGTSTNYKQSGNGTLFELGTGYFTRTAPKSPWVFETYGGVGFGGVNNKYEASNEQSKIGVTKLWVQPSIGYVDPGNTIDFYIASRFSFVNLKVKSSTVATAPSTNSDNIKAIRNDPNPAFWEPSFGMRLGGKDVKANLQITFATPLQSVNFNYQPVVFSLGITANLNRQSR